METGDKIRENFMAKVFKTAETMYTESIGQIEEEPGSQLRVQQDAVCLGKSQGIW